MPCFVSITSQVVAGLGQALSRDEGKDRNHHEQREEWEEDALYFHGDSSYDNNGKH